MDPQTIKRDSTISAFMSEWKTLFIKIPGGTVAGSEKFGPFETIDWLADQDLTIWVEPTSHGDHEVYVSGANGSQLRNAYALEKGRREHLPEMKPYRVKDMKPDK